MLIPTIRSDSPVHGVPGSVGFECRDGFGYCLPLRWAELVNVVLETLVERDNGDSNSGVDFGGWELVPAWWLLRQFR